MENTTSQLLTRILQTGLAFLLILAPLPFGSVQDEWIFLLQFGTCLLLGLWIFRQLTQGRIRLVRTGLYWPILLLLGYLLLTLAPLPPSLLGMLSPETMSLHQQASRTLSEYGLTVSSWFRISLTPFDTRGEILKIAVYAIFFLLCMHVLRLRKGFVAVYVLLIVYGSLMAVFGLIQNTWSNGRIYWRFESGGGSPFGPFVNHNHFAGYLELTLGLSLGMFVAEVRRYREHGGIHGIAGFFAWIWQKRDARPWLLLIASFITLAGLIASLSRGGVLSVVCATAVFAVATILASRSQDSHSSPATPPYWRALLLVPFVLLIGLIAVLAFSERAKSRWQRMYDEAGHYRVQVWRDSLGAIADYPVTGTGLGSFRSVFPRYKGGSFLSESTHAENEYIQWTLEAGLLGLALAALIFVLFIYRVLSRLRRRKDVYYRSLTGGALFSLVSLSFHNLMDFNLHIPSNALTFAAVAALCLLAVNFRSGRHGDRLLLEESSLTLKSLKGAMTLGIVLVVLAVFGWQTWDHYQSLRAADQFERERVYLLRGDPEEVQFSLLQRALEASSWNDRAYFLKASAYEAAGAAGGGLLQLFKRRGFIEQARLAVLQAIRLRPPEARYWASLGRIETAARNRGAAERSFQYALKLAGSNANIRRDYGQSLLFAGDIQRGAELLASARKFGTNLNLRDLLDTLARYTNDREVWQRLVRDEPADLRTYAAFLGSRGLSALETEALKRAAALEQSSGRH